MRVHAEIDTEIAHVQYARSLLDNRLEELKAERDLLRDDKYINEKLTRRLAEFFKTHNLCIVNLQCGVRSEDHYSLARQIWDSPCKVLIPFVKKLSVNTSMLSYYDTAGISLQRKNDIKNFCDVLAKKGWLTYSEREKDFAITPSLNGEQKSFIRGGWAEAITLYLIVNTLNEFTQKRHLKYKLFWNVELKWIYPATNYKTDMQLDLVAQIGERFYVFETKSGDVLGVIKWVERTKLFDDQQNRFITCTLDDNLNKQMFKDLRLFKLGKLKQQLTTLLERDFLAVKESSKDHS